MKTKKTFEISTLSFNDTIPRNSNDDNVYSADHDVQNSATAGSSGDDHCDKQIDSKRRSIARLRD